MKNKEIVTGSEGVSRGEHGASSECWESHVEDEGHWGHIVGKQIDDARERGLKLYPKEINATNAI